jgi:hypothetical protein
MTADGYVFPVDMSPEDMERRKNSMMLTSSVFTKCETVYELFAFSARPSTVLALVHVSVHLPWSRRIPCRCMLTDVPMT